MVNSSVPPNAGQTSSLQRLQSLQAAERGQGTHRHKHVRHNIADDEDNAEFLASLQAHYKPKSKHQSSTVE